MTLVGMDPGQVRELAAALSRSSGALREIRQQAGGELSSAGWDGVDAAQFREQWTRCSADLMAAAEGLDAAQKVLLKQADEQVQASEASGGTTGWLASGAGPGDAGSQADDGAEYGEADPDVADAWRSMSAEDRKKVAQEIVNAEFAKYGMDPVEIEFANLEGYGSWDEAGGKLRINERLLGEPRLLHTLAHEVRHAAQHQIIRDTDRSFWDYIFFDTKEEELNRYGVTREEVDSWENNFENYISPRSNYEAYYRQPVEVDARKSGRDFVNSLSFEDLQEYQRKAGVPVSKR